MKIIQKLQISAIVNFLLFLATFIFDYLYYLVFGLTIVNLSVLLSLFYYDLFFRNKNNYKKLKINSQ